MSKAIDTYKTPIKDLFALGESYGEDVPDYLAMGFSEEHLPDLIRLASDVKLHFDVSVPFEHFFAIIHAWRILAILKAEAAIAPLIPLFHHLKDSDWIEIFVDEFWNPMGELALPDLKNYFADNMHDEWARGWALDPIVNFAKANPAICNDIVQLITNSLNQYTENSLAFNASLISKLVDLNAKESFDVIEKAFEAKQVDLTFAGGLPSVKEAFGLEVSDAEREQEAKDVEDAWEVMFPGITAMRKQFQEGDFSIPPPMPFRLSVDVDNFDGSVKPRNAKKKKKLKRKQSAKSRKQNRKRKK